MMRMRKSDLRKLKVGQWVRVRYDDVGVRDSIVVKFDDDRSSFGIIEPGGDFQWVESDQVISAGPLVSVPAF